MNSETKAAVVINGVVAVIRREDNHFLIAERPLGKPLGGYWEFPGGKIDPDETVLEALNREILEELGIHIVSAEHFLHIYYSYPEFDVNLQIYLVHHFEGEGQGLEGQKVCWVHFDELDNFLFPPATPPLLEKIKAVFGGRI